jgi:hypothetical protein
VKVYRWDLDKTYLDTDFESFRGLVRSATEPAHRKRALPGAATLLRSLGGSSTAKVTVISGSPTQMRKVLSEKLALDGVEFDELVLKDNLGNLKKGRLRAIRGQIGYKLPALLEARVRTEDAAVEVLFGDDVEADALVYSLYADAVSGRVGAAEVSRVMERAGAYPDEIDRGLEALAKVKRHDAVERIFIRLERGVPTHRLSALGPRVVPVYSWWQAALVLLEMGHLDLKQVQEVMAPVFWEEGTEPWVMGALAQDLLRRGWVQPETLMGLHGPPEIIDACVAAVQSLGGCGVEVSGPVDTKVDYIKLLKTGAWNKRGRAE